MELDFVYELLGRRGRQCHHCPCMCPCLSARSCFPSSVLLASPRPEQCSTRSCTLHPRTLQCFTERCEHHPSPRGCDPGTQRLRSKLCQLFSETWFWPRWEVLSISTAGQSPLRSCRCSAPLARSPRAACTPCQRPGWEEAGELNVSLKGSTANQWQRMTTNPFLSLCS